MGTDRLPVTGGSERILGKISGREPMGYENARKPIMAHMSSAC
jgi:hypothetical protein